MDKKRKAYAPFSLTSEAGVAQTPVEGYIDVNQTIYPTVQTGVVNENGTWVGVKANDANFLGLSKDIGVANGAAILAPTGALEKDNFINMDGFSALQIAIKPTNQGTYGIDAVFGPDTIKFANLSPVTSGQNIRAIWETVAAATFNAVVNDSNEALIADAWNILTVYNRLANQLLLQFKITNSSGDASDIEFAYRRLV